MKEEEKLESLKKSLARILATLDKPTRDKFLSRIEHEVELYSKDKGKQEERIEKLNKKYDNSKVDFDDIWEFKLTANYLGALAGSTIAYSIPDADWQYAIVGGCSGLVSGSLSSLIYLYHKYNKGKLRKNIAKNKLKRIDNKLLHAETEAEIIANINSQIDKQETCM